MNTKNIVLISFLTLTTIHSYGQIEQDSINTTQQTAKQVEIPIYQLFPTENHWAFIKLDTRNGKMWQVHFTISEDLFRGELILNTSSLVWKDEEINGRFTLYPTKNMYNFILLDQVTGKTYQVQWSNEENDRLIIPIY